MGDFESLTCAWPDDHKVAQIGRRMRSRQRQQRQDLGPGKVEYKRTFQGPGGPRTPLQPAGAPPQSSPAPLPISPAHPKVFPAPLAAYACPTTNLRLLTQKFLLPHSQFPLPTQNFSLPH